MVEIILVYQEKDTQCLYALQEQTPGFSIINYVLHTSMLNSSSLKIKKMTLKKNFKVKKTTRFIFIIVCQPGSTWRERSSGVLTS